ncbi:acetyl-CoA decarbonylase/synthase complex subunit epsilon [Methanocaldococcus villosus KIN24-T80]|uniref:Acetyl-CoA decarbonylase/synthase complex subunit epsilon n=1 Tax=Methanocaldococcus villosus KIN24-T80 TaxID=1069083 RepID=N6VYS0_9EURY|nr:CO dehydrogenase/acetyl-CoA synthase complex subunit epsilon [Methanocaldococcus villosus]ENN96277.1 acetyl-CoA decarbonylase/synthase complex subunit epsilon [Methanocaldococcus villosus KIN24-T80]
MDRFTPYIITAGSNTNHAEVISPSALKMMIKRARSPILILGEKCEREIIDRLIETYKLKVIKTPEEMNLMIVMKYLTQSEHDLAIFVGITYYYLAQALMHLKHFSNLVTVSIDRYYQPNAHYSFPNLDEKEYLDYLNRLIE